MAASTTPATATRSQDFSKFQKSIHHHVLTTFKHSKDLSTAILEFTDPLAALQQNRPSLSSIRVEHGLQMIPAPTNKSKEDKELRESENQDRKDMVKIIFNNDIKSLSERQRDLTQNLTILWATILGQCTPALREEISSDPDYTSKSVVFDSIWLLQNLQKVTAGVNKTTNRYFSAFKATKSFYNTQQSYTESVDEYFGAVQNIKGPCTTLQC